MWHFLISFSDLFFLLVWDCTFRIFIVIPRSTIQDLIHSGRSSSFLAGSTQDFRRYFSLGLFKTVLPLVLFRSRKSHSLLIPTHICAYAFGNFCRPFVLSLVSLPILSMLHFQHTHFLNILALSITLIKNATHNHRLRYSAVDWFVSHTHTRNS